MEKQNKLGKVLYPNFYSSGPATVNASEGRILPFKQKPKATPKIIKVSIEAKVDMVADDIIELSVILNKHRTAILELESRMENREAVFNSRLLELVQIIKELEKRVRS